MKIKSYLSGFFKRPEYVFAVPALIFGIISATFLPQLIANDENMHFIRSYALTDLEISHTCNLPVDIKERGFFAIYARDTPDYSFNTDRVDEADRLDTDCGTATSYNPLLHTPQAIGIEMAKLTWPTTGAMILFGRIMNVLVYTIGLFFIIRYAKIGKWLLVVIGLLPTMVHMAGTLSGDVVNNLIILGFISYIFNLFVQKTSMTKKQVGILLILAALLAAAKPTNLPLLLPILFLPKKVLPVVKLRKWKASPRIARLLMALLSGGAAIAVLVAWMYIRNATTLLDDTGFKNPIEENPVYFIQVLFNTYINPDVMVGGVSYSDWLLRGVAGSFASFRYHLPYSVVFMLIGIFIIIGLKKDSNDQAQLSGLSTALLVVSTLLSLVIIVLAMTYGLFVAWAIPNLGESANYALGLQGRYFTPLLLLLSPLLVYLRRFISVDIAKGITTGLLVFIVMSISLTFYVVQTATYIEKLALIQ